MLELPTEKLARHLRSYRRAQSDRLAFLPPSPGRLVPCTLSICARSRLHEARLSGAVGPWRRVFSPRSPTMTSLKGKLGE